MSHQFRETAPPNVPSRSPAGYYISIRLALGVLAPTYWVPGAACPGARRSSTGERYRGLPSPLGVSGNNTTYNFEPTSGVPQVTGGGQINGLPSGRATF